MRTRVRLAKNGTFTVKVLTASPPPTSGPPLNFGFVTLHGQAGDGTLEIADAVPPSLAPTAVPIPGMLVAMVRQKSNTVPTVIIKAGDGGFDGEIDVEPFKVV